MKDFVESLQESDKTKVVAILDRTKDEGPPMNREKCDSLTDGLLEFKSFQDRIIWFYDGKDGDGRGRIVMTHGFKKKSQKTRPGELKKARDMRNEYRQGRRR